MTRPGKIPAQAEFETGIFRSRGGRLNHKANESVGTAGHHMPPQSSNALVLGSNLNSRQKVKEHLQKLELFQNRQTDLAKILTKLGLTFSSMHTKFRYILISGSRFINTFVTMGTFSKFAKVARVHFSS